MRQSMDIAVREADAGDRPRLVALLQALNAHEDALTGDRRTDRAGAEETLDATLARLARSGGLILVAEVAGEVVGLVSLTFEDGAAYVRPAQRPHAHIIELVVDEGSRRQGIALRLLEAAEQLAAERGYRRLTISVMAGNSAAEAAYRRRASAPTPTICRSGSADPRACRRARDGGRHDRSRPGEVGISRAAALPAPPD